MNEKNKNIICLSILVIVPVILLILCFVGNSSKRKETPEHFFSNITNYFSPKEIPKMDDPLINIEPTMTDSNFPADNVDDKEVLKRKLPNTEHNYNNFTMNDINNKFKPASTSTGMPSLDSSILDSKAPASNIHKNLNDTAPDGLNDLKNTVSSNKDIPPINRSGHAKGGPLELEKNVDMSSLMGGDSFKFFDSNYVPDKNNYVYTGAEIGVDGNTAINFKCHGGEEPIQAEAIALVNEEGKISDIKLINKGSGYKKAKISIEGGGGRGAKAVAVVDDNSTISHIEVTNQGHQYASTPTIIIGNPNQNKSCKLFFKKK
jgi:hypothetical protein